jgi:HAD superfamily hydrolase (TIGR01484 family)
MHNIKLVAVDLDDTLLRDDLTISQFSRDVLQQVQEAGVTVTLATGRMLPSALPYAEQLGFDVPLITYQGALVKNAFSGEVLYNCPLSKDVAGVVIRYGRKRKIHVNLYVEDKLFVERVTKAGSILIDIKSVIKVRNSSPFHVNFSVHNHPLPMIGGV